MNIGVNNKRPARLNVCLGSDFTTASKRIKAYKFVGDTEDEEVSVLSGEPVIAVSDIENGNVIAFKKVNPADLKGKAVYWAFSDYNKNGRDFDNMAIKKLEAIYSGDKFEITTPFFDTTKAYVPGAKLKLVSTVKPEGGQVGPTKVIVAPVEEGDGADVVVIGRVSDGVINLGGDGVDHNIAVAGSTDVNADDIIDQFVVGGPRTYTNDTSSKYVLKFFTELA